MDFKLTVFNNSAIWGMKHTSSLIIGSGFCSASSDWLLKSVTRSPESHCVESWFLLQQGQNDYKLKVTLIITYTTLLTVLINIWKVYMKLKTLKSIVLSIFWIYIINWCNLHPVCFSYVMPWVSLWPTV